MRAFLAVELDRLLRDHVARAQASVKDKVSRGARGLRLTWVRPEAMHLTMAFFAELDGSLVPRLRAAVARAVADRPPLALPLDRLGVFPQAREPRVLWLGPSDEWVRTADARRLTDLHDDIAAACEALGLPREAKPWHPHLSLARVRDGEREVGRLLRQSGALNEATGVPPLAIGTLSLIKSDLAAAGPVHTPLWHVTLGTS